jgi:NADH:ubiquinone oxidoreductase subunit 4 (subunit M)
LTAGAAAEEGGASFRVKSWGVVLFLLFITGVFVGLAIVLDWKDIVDDPAAYTGLAGTALGATLGYITGDAVGTATS